MDTLTNRIKMIFTAVAIPVLSTGCLFGPKDGGTTASSSATPRYLYVASGACFSPAATQSGNRVITKYNLSNGAAETFYDFNADGSYDLPGGMVDLGGSILVAVNPYDNSATNIKQIISIDKTTKAKNVFYQDATYLPAGAANTVRALARSPVDGNIYVSRSAQVEKIDFGTKFKLPNFSGTFANAFYNGIATGMGAVACLGVTATASTVIHSIVITPTGKAIMSHSVLAQNKIAVAPAVGVDTTGGCTSTAIGVPINVGATPTVGTAAASTGTPTALIRHSVSGKVLVAMSGLAANANYNSVVAYTYNDTTGVLTTPPTVGYYNTGNLFQPTAMVEDTDTGEVYVASFGQLASGAMGFIRKFSVNASTGAMTDAGMFAQSPLNTKCVSSMFIGQ